MNRARHQTSAVLNQIGRRDTGRTVRVAVNGPARRKPRVDGGDERGGDGWMGNVSLDEGSGGARPDDGEESGDATTQTMAAKDEATAQEMIFRFQFRKEKEGKEAH